VASGESEQYSVSSADAYGLWGNWSQVSGGVLGLGGCSSAVFTGTEAWTSLELSSCSGDVGTTSPTCPEALTVQSNVTLGLGQTCEGNNLQHVAPASLADLNSDLALSKYYETTTGSCFTTPCTCQTCPTGLSCGNGDATACCPADEVSSKGLCCPAGDWNSDGHCCPTAEVWSSFANACEYQRVGLPGPR
jgi:hypothetical protein